MHYAMSVLLIAVTVLGTSVYALTTMMGGFEIGEIPPGTYKMVDKPYTPFAITDDAQSLIVPTLIRQER
jgi:hypothetical protein